MRIILHREALDFGRQCHIFENYRAEKGRNNEVRKGSIYNPTIILCAQPFKEFVKDGTIPPAEKAKSELCVAITRARYSVVFVYDQTSYQKIFTFYDPRTSA